jgi:hypothetical protein
MHEVGFVSSHFCFAMLLASYVLYVCVLLHANVVKLMDGLKLLFNQDNLYLFVHVRTCGASVRLVHPRTEFKVANSSTTDRSKVVTPRVLIFVNCLWCPF